MIPVPDHANGKADTLADGDMVNRVQQLRLGAQTAGKAAARRGGGWLPWLLCAMLAAAWASVGVKWSRSSGTDVRGPAGPVAGKASAAPSAGAQTGSVAGSGDVLLQIKGNLTPVLQIAVSPIDVAGRVTEIHFKEGDRVEKDFVLARLDPKSYLHDYEEADFAFQAAESRYKGDNPDAVRPIEVEQAQAELDEAIANRSSAQKEIDRLERLRVSGANSQQDYDKASADLQATKARVIRLEKSLALLVMGPRKERLAALRQDYLAAQARRAKAKWRLDNCDLKAPINGTVLNKKADIGGLVNPLAFSSSSSSGGGSSGSVCEVADLSQMEVEIDVPERDIGKMRANLDCEVTADRDANRPYRGRIDRIMPIADDSKNVIKVRVQVFLPPGEVPGTFLVPKMSAVATVYNREFADAKRDKSP